MPKPDPETQNLFADAGAATSVLIAEDITAMARNGRLISSDFDDKSLQETSYDLRVGERAIVGGNSQGQQRKAP